MTFLRSDRLRRAVLLTAFFALALITLALGVNAATSCGHDVGTENGFCLEMECHGYEIPTLNEGNPEIAGDEYYEIANAGQLYWFKNELIQKKETATVVRAKLTAHITVNAALLNEDGTVKDTYFDENGDFLGYTWYFPAKVCNVVIDGDGYTVSGLYGVRTDTSNAGLFGTAENVTVKNLGILDSLFSSYNAYTGTFFGEAIGGCVLENCFALDSTSTGAMPAGLVGKLGFSGEVNRVTDCYTDAAVAIFSCAAGNTVTGCYYLSENEDTIEGTTPVSALNTETMLTILNAGATLPEGLAWQFSCLRGAPVLRAEHYYKNVCDADCVNFKVCKHSRADGEEGKVPHKFDNKCDAECNICKNIRTLEKDHYYSNVCDTDCNECGATRKAPEDHKYTNKCDEYCNYCQFKRVPPIVGHEYSNDCDEYCNQCNYKRAGATHDFVIGCEIKVCSVCATTAPSDISHSFDNACDSDCNNCGMKRDAGHQFGEFVVVTEPTLEAEGRKERVCSICGTKEQETLAKLVPEEKSNLVLYLSIGGGALLLVGAAAVVVLILLKKKGGKKPDEKTAKEAPEQPDEKAAEEAPEEE